MAVDDVHERLLAIVKRLPETEEAWPWGSIHCKVAGKIFVGWSRDRAGAMCLGVRTTPELQATLVASDPRFSVAKYTGRYGGIDVRLGSKPNWAEIEELIVGSYRIIAPKRLVRALDEQPTKPARTKNATAKKRPAAKLANRARRGRPLVKSRRP